MLKLAYNDRVKDENRGSLVYVIPIFTFWDND